MKQKSFSDMECPIARSVERLGAGWSTLILREAFYGATKFDEFQQGLEGIAPTTLTSRLKELVESGLLERRLYSERPPRYEYVLTSVGREFRPVLWAMMEWGNRNFCPEGAIVHIEHRETGQVAQPYLADRSTGDEMLPAAYRVAAGPGASPTVRKKVASSHAAEARRQAASRRTRRE